MMPYVIGAAVLLFLGPIGFLLAFVSLACHESGHVIGAMMAGIDGQHSITLGVGRRVGCWSMFGVEVNLNIVPMLQGFWSVTPTPMGIANGKILMAFLGGAAMNLVLALVSFFAVGLQYEVACRAYRESCICLVRLTCWVFRAQLSLCL